MMRWDSGRIIEWILLPELMNSDKPSYLSVWQKSSQGKIHKKRKQEKRLLGGFPPQGNKLLLPKLSGAYNQVNCRRRRTLFCSPEYAFGDQRYIVVKSGIATHTVVSFSTIELKKLNKTIVSRIIAREKNDS